VLQENGQKINLQVATIVQEDSIALEMLLKLYVKLDLSQMVIKQLAQHVLVQFIAILHSSLKQEPVHLVKFVLLLLRRQLL
jgi:hypothetical protein